MRHYWIVYVEERPGYWKWYAEFRYKVQAKRYAKMIPAQTRIEKGEVGI